ncbi:hypothetical protein I203_104845 [Kwoniella mangroviensis CBS 8507]|uniref:uncharacterized protein n=1 Tax=Kwoniella mangroviensis CBS 8507 TaxID=1296122 RepID=UPI00080D6667|nr:uncharacterized protein I203_00213 [Kwoniella mangroviensis CBS 8507]OCF70082.1 hypothetical protein I203_00213 [Kwoniella mangroviensis CBS 8507]
MECLETYLIPTITVDHPDYPLGQTVEVPRNSRDHRISYHWSVPGGSGVCKLYRPLFDPRSTINTAIYKAEKSRKDEIVNLLIQSAHVAVDHISSTIPNAESKERLRQLNDGPASWLLKTRFRSDVSDMILQNQKGLSGLDDPSGLSFVIGWEYNGVKMRDDSDILLRYIDKHDTDQGWFADIQAPRPINLSELPLDQIMN